MSKNKLLIVGCGDIGARVAQGHNTVQIRGLARSDESARRLRTRGITPVCGDLDQRTSLNRLSGLAPWVLHLGPPPGDGDGDPRTRRLIAALAKGGSLPRRLVYISTSGVYGDCNGERVAETRPSGGKQSSRPAPGGCRTPVAPICCASWHPAKHPAGARHLRPRPPAA